ncbi:MAG: cupredoxin domain-containing protein, partial [Pyrinomonadaceae bacterium]|nr:cupredoxin domain-containing protein [Pyrinomonadaceae bacterium]
FVIISEDATDFLHAHPMTKDEMSDLSGMQGHGDDHESAPHSHDPTEMKQKARAQASASEVAAHTIFPRAGLYKVWGQFKRSGQVISVPYVVHVAGSEDVRAEEKVSSTGANQPAPADGIKVSVSSAGYTPSRIEVQKGKPIKLAFYRSDGENCGDEVVFPALNLRKKLPVGETTVVEVTPAESGELAFTCGMKMFRGTLVVN